MELIYDFKKFSFSTQFALACFCVGTLLFGLFFLFPQNDGVVITGLFFVIFATFFNGLVFLNLLYQLATRPKEKEIILIKIMILMANIPISILYFYLIINSVKKNSSF